jgi:2-methylisocitrate lyase-like PEP mutase family enzyme
MDRETQRQYAETFRGLHQKGNPVVLFNAWDVASAKVIAQKFPAIATSSAAVAASLGYTDGQKTPLAAVLNLVERITATVSVPLTVDFEAGYGDTPEEAAESVAALLRAGAIGINLEDGLLAGQRTLVDPALHAAKIRAIRRVADDYGVRLVINARTDPFILKFGSPEVCLEEAVRRGAIYAEAGADSLFVPLLTDLALIETLVGRVELPVNIMAMPTAPSIPELAWVGVGRVSLATWPYRAAMRAVEAAAQVVATTGEYGAFLKPDG